KPWYEIKNMFISRFQVAAATPIDCAIDRRWKMQSETIQEYYLEKMQFLDRVVGLTSADKTRLLTRGLPNDYQEYINLLMVKDPYSWLAAAINLEATKSRQERSRRFRQQQHPVVQFAKPDFKPDYA